MEGPGDRPLIMSQRIDMDNALIHFEGPKIDFVSGRNDRRERRANISKGI